MKVGTSLKSNYRSRLIKSLNGVLILFLLLVHLIPKRIEFNRELNVPLIPNAAQFQVVPATRQAVRHGMKPPKRPVIPIASEDPDVPMDLTIEETEFDWNAGDSRLGTSSLTTSRADTVPPRPMLQVLPEYPKELRKQNVRGDVKLYLWVSKQGVVQDAVVASNTTGNRQVEKAAIEAAMKSKYLPAHAADEKIATWVACVYSFTPD